MQSEKNGKQYSEMHNKIKTNKQAYKNTQVKYKIRIVGWMGFGWF